MNWTTKAVFGLILLLVGGNILLKMLGIHLGGLLGIAVAIILIIFGYKKTKEVDKARSQLFGIAILIFGALLLLGQAHMLGGLFIAAIIIYFGYQLLKRDSNHEEKQELKEEVPTTWKDEFDDEWQTFLNKWKV